MTEIIFVITSLVLINNSYKKYRSQEVNVLGKEVDFSYNWLNMESFTIIVQTIKLNVVVYRQLFITILAFKYAQSFYNHFINHIFHIKCCHSQQLKYIDQVAKETKQKILTRS